VPAVKLMVPIFILLLLQITEQRVVLSVEKINQNMTQTVNAAILTFNII